MALVYRILDTVLPFAWLSTNFMKNAFIAIIFTGLLFGFLGSMVVNNKMSFFSEALGHSALTGIALGVILGMEEMYSMIIFAIIFAVGIWFVEKRRTISTDTIIGVFSSSAIALGIVLLSLGRDFSSYSKFLIGDILLVKPSEILLLIITFVIAITLWMIFFNKMVLGGLNSLLARSRKINVDIMRLIFVIVLAVVVMIAIKWVGILIINSLLILPAATARNVSRNLKQYTLLSVLFSLFSSISGLIISYYLETSTGATIVLVSAILFFITLVKGRKLIE
ncbi:MAG: metal ABC transporter permease [Clostridia bacterium]|nr:metal ABC transporter permease [Clostridia bacterium]